MSIIKSFAISALLFVGAPAYAEIDTRTVMQGAIADEHTTEIILMAIVEGIIVYNAITKEKILCMPNMNFTGASYLSLFSNFVNEHPSVADGPAAITMFLALKKGFPCAKY